MFLVPVCYSKSSLTPLGRRWAAQEVGSVCNGCFLLVFASCSFLLLLLASLCSSLGSSMSHRSFGDAPALHDLPANCHILGLSLPQLALPMGCNAWGLSLPWHGSPTATGPLWCPRCSVNRPQPQSLWSVTAPAQLTHSHSLSRVSLPQCGSPMGCSLSEGNFWQGVHPSRSVSPAVSPTASFMCPLPFHSSKSVSFSSQVFFGVSSCASCPQRLPPFLKYIWEKEPCAPLTGWNVEGWVVFMFQSCCGLIPAGN